jgi:excisionase family DNA binding protein
MHELNSITDSARELGISRAQVYRELREGRLKAVHIGKRTLITRKALEEYIASLPPFEAA